MTTPKDTGGHAFPNDPNTYGECRGMTIRDYFAAKALGGLINYSPDAEEHVSIAALCYQLADAMLEARK